MKFDTFDDAVGRARSRGCPVTAWIGAARWKVFPSGRANLDLSVKSLPEHCRTRTVAMILKSMRGKPDRYWPRSLGKSPDAIPARPELWPMLCDALQDAGGDEIADAIRLGMVVMAG